MRKFLLFSFISITTIYPQYIPTYVESSVGLNNPFLEAGRTELEIADINNDGNLDIYTLDMLPEDNERQKLLYGPENYEQYALMIQEGFHHQNMRNMLQLNQGDGNFAEIGQLANISNSDWSWSALFFDATNSGNQDLFISNGYFRDYTNRDFLKYKGDYYFQQAIAKEKADTLHLVTSMTSTPVHNYIFENQGNLDFKDH